MHGEKLKLLIIGKLKSIISSYSRYAFFNYIKDKKTLLDVGYGGKDSYLQIKTFLPNIHYTGIDVLKYEHLENNKADKFILSDPESFAHDINLMAETYDVVFSSHNLEHCNNWDETIAAMIHALKGNGILYLAVPSQRSINFPSRKGTLNYYDDKGHKENPPEYLKIMKQIQEKNMEIIYSTNCYKPVIPCLIGFLLEPISKKMDKNIRLFTWAYWGFETIIWAKKKGYAPGRAAVCIKTDICIT